MRLLPPKEHYKQNTKTRVQLITTPYLNTEYLGFFMGSTTKEIASPLIRQAINYGFDREKMVTYLRNGMAIAATHGFYT